jgi:hypothetical protein
MKPTRNKEKVKKQMLIGPRASRKYRRGESEN